MKLHEFPLQRVKGVFARVSDSYGSSDSLEEVIGICPEKNPEDDHPVNVIRHYKHDDRFEVDVYRYVGPVTQEDRDELPDEAMVCIEKNGEFISVRNRPSIEAQAIKDLSGSMESYKVEHKAPQLDEDGNFIQPNRQPNTQRFTI